MNEEFETEKQAGKVAEKLEELHDNGEIEIEHVKNRLHDIYIQSEGNKPELYRLFNRLLMMLLEIELQKGYRDGINIFEAGDVYIVADYYEINEKAYEMIKEKFSYINTESEGDLFGQ